MSTYERCPKAVNAVLEQALGFHPLLKASGATFDLIFAYAPRDKDGQPKGPAIRRHGYPACAVVKVNDLRRRAAGGADAEVLIDGDEWPHWPAPKRVAILDHELTHLEPAEFEPGRFETDDLKRPVLVMRLHDWQLGGFGEVIDRHGEHAVDLEAIQIVVDNSGQHFWRFLRPPETTGRAEIAEAAAEESENLLAKAIAERPVAAAARQVAADPAMRRALIAMIPDEGAVTISTNIPGVAPVTLTAADKHRLTRAH